MKILTVLAALMLLQACASAPIKPVWQQELEQIGRQWSSPAPIVQPPKSIAPVYGYNYAMGMEQPVRMCWF